MTDLEIPERALTVACDVYDATLCNEAQSDIEVAGECAERQAVRAAAPIIVAAELRRLAVELYDGPQRWPDSKVALLRRRADELDPEGPT